MGMLESWRLQEPPRGSWTEQDQQSSIIFQSPDWSEGGPVGGLLIKHLLLSSCSFMFKHLVGQSFFLCGMMDELLVSLDLTLEWMLLGSS